MKKKCYYSFFSSLGLEERREENSVRRGWKVEEKKGSNGYKMDEIVGKYGRGWRGPNVKE